jgi:SAM-dependent methyltransferase
VASYRIAHLLRVHTCGYHQIRQHIYHVFQCQTCYECISIRAGDREGTYTSMSPSPLQATRTRQGLQSSSQTDVQETEGEPHGAEQDETLFENPFHIDDLMIFDDTSMRRLFDNSRSDLRLEDLATSVHGAPKALIRRIKSNLTPKQRSLFMQEVRRSLPRKEVQAARKRVLDSLFWELTYWKTPGLYEELTEGEKLHPGIFRSLEPDIRGKTIADVGAGSGRATFECLRYGAKLVYAVEPSPGLLHILEQKLLRQPAPSRVIPYQGSFSRIPLGDRSVDIALSCSAFTSEPEQGGEVGLVELQRVTKPGGKIVLIWPRQEDRHWLAAHGFHYVAMPVHNEMRVHFRSLRSAIRCARLFYGHNRSVVHYIRQKRQPEVPFSVLGLNPPCDYCWQTVGFRPSGLKQ